MGFQEFLIDAKNIILGKADENSIVNFKQEIDEAVKSGLITKAEAAKMIEVYNNQKKEAKEFDKKQLSTISLEDGSRVNVDEAKKSKEEIERKKKLKEQQRLASEIARNEVEKNKSISKPQKKSDKVTIDRAKLQKVIEKDEQERDERSKKNIKTREEGN